MANLENHQSLTAQQSRDFANALTRGIAAALAQPISAATATTNNSSSADHPGLLRRRQLPQAADPPASNSSTANTTPQPSNQTLTAAQAYNALVDGAFLISAAQSVTLGGSAEAAGSAGVCVAPALLPQKLAGGFQVAFGCRGISAPAEVSAARFATTSI
jgi:hypothetical protein